MATLKRCDGCKTTAESSQTADWSRLEIELRSEDNNPDWTFDLCRTCTDVFMKQHLPGRWPVAREP